MQAEEPTDLAALFRDTAPRGRAMGCPEPDQLWAATAGELSLKPLQSLVDHSARCGECSEALQMARDLRNASGPLGKETLAPRPSRPRWLVGLALAAGVAGLGVISHFQREPHESALERGVLSPTLRSALADERQPRTNLVLRWWAYPHAVRYDVTLATTDLRVLFQQAGVAQTEIAIPSAALSGLAAGTRLIWRVEASLEDGRSVESPAFMVTVE
jgi:hypothetical protein